MFASSSESSGCSCGDRTLISSLEESESEFEDSSVDGATADAGAEAEAEIEGFVA